MGHKFIFNLAFISTLFSQVSRSLRAASMKKLANFRLQSITYSKIPINSFSEIGNMNFVGAKHIKYREIRTELKFTDLKRRGNAH